MMVQVTFYPSDVTGTQFSPSQVSGVVYHFNLTSKHPLTSTMTTDMSTDLYGATVSCSNGTTHGSTYLNLVSPSK